jgi:hypothetical protein
VETITKIRLAYFRDGKPIKQICRELRVSRNTVRRVIRSSEQRSEPRIDRQTGMSARSRISDVDRQGFSAISTSDRFGVAAPRHANRAERLLWADHVAAPASGLRCTCLEVAVGSSGVHQRHIVRRHLDEVAPRAAAQPAPSARQVISMHRGGATFFSFFSAH